MKAEEFNLNLIEKDIEFEKYFIEAISFILANDNFGEDSRKTPKIKECQATLESTAASVKNISFEERKKFVLNIRNHEKNEKPIFSEALAKAVISSLLIDFLKMSNKSRDAASAIKGKIKKNKGKKSIRKIKDRLTKVEEKYLNLFESFMIEEMNSESKKSNKHQKKDEKVVYEKIKKLNLNQCIEIMSWLLENSHSKKSTHDNSFQLFKSKKGSKSNKIDSMITIEQSELIELLRKIANSLNRLEDISTAVISEYKNSEGESSPLKDRRLRNAFECFNKIESLRKHLEKFISSKKSFNELYETTLTTYEELNNLTKRMPIKNIKNILRDLEWLLKNKIEMVPKALWVEKKDQPQAIKKFNEKVDQLDNDFYDYMKVIKELKNKELLPDQRKALEEMKQNNRWEKTLSDFEIRSLGGGAVWAFKFSYPNKSSGKKEVFILKVNIKTGTTLNTFDGLLQYYNIDVNKNFISKSEVHSEIRPKIYRTISTYNSEIPFSIVLSEFLPGNLLEESEKLHSSGCNKQEILKIALKRFTQLLEIYIKLDKADLYFTDGKLPNYYLNSNDDIVLSDAKSFLGKSTKFGLGDILYTQGYVFSRPGEHSNCSQIQKDTIFTTLVAYLLNISAFELKESRRLYPLYLLEKAEQFSDKLIKTFENNSSKKGYIEVLHKIKSNIREKTKNLVKIENIGGCLEQLICSSDKFKDSEVLKGITDIMLKKNKENQYGDYLVLTILREIQLNLGKDGIKKVKDYCSANNLELNISMKGKKIEDLPKEMTIRQKFKFVELITDQKALQTLGLKDEVKDVFLKAIDHYIKCWDKSILQFEQKIMKKGNLKLEDSDKFALRILKNSRYSEDFQSVPTLNDLFSGIDNENPVVADLKIEFERMIKEGEKNYDSDMRNDFVLFCKSLNTFSNGETKEFFNLLCKLCPESSLSKQSHSTRLENKSSHGNLTKILSETHTLMEASHKETDDLSESESTLSIPEM